MARTVRLGRREIEVRKILCVGRNYAAHAAEMGAAPPDEPVFFLKPSTALAHPSGGDLFIPEEWGLLHHEVELALLLGGGGRDLSPGEAGEAVLGCAVALDLTLRDVQSRAKKAGGPWTVAKGFDGSAPVGGFLPVSSLKDLGDLALTLSVNGEVRQASRTSRMIFSPAELVAHASSRMTLEEGDLLFTGTPEGVGPLVDGDRVVASLEGLPDLTLTLRR